MNSVELLIENSIFISRHSYVSCNLLNTCFFFLSVRHYSVSIQENRCCYEIGRIVVLIRTDPFRRDLSIFDLHVDLKLQCVGT